jgi:hypothetical protein
LAEGPTEAELLEQLQAELQKLKVSDVLVQTVVTLSSLGFHRLSQESRDVDQARQAIDAIKALLPLLEGAVPPEVVRDLQQTVANMQLSYAKAVASPAEPEGSPGDAEPT